MGYCDISLGLSIAFMLAGLVALAWSSDVFVDGSAVLARALGISPFVIGMVVIGFGTSAPELCVSVMSGLSGHASLSLGNAYGSCTFNIAVILGVSALILPLVTRPSVTLVAGPGLAAITLLSWLLLRDGTCSRAEALVLLAAFAVLLPLYCWFDQKRGKRDEGWEMRDERRGMRDEGWEMGDEKGGVREVAAALVKVAVGLAVLVGSSHFLVWGAVDFAKFLGVSDLVIGLTIVAAGTSLPELASAIASARRGEHEFVLGNIIGSNLFNTLAVVGLATFLSPFEATADGSPAFSPYILTRDLPVMALASLSILFFGLNWRHPKEPGVISRKDAVVWILTFAIYTVVMFLQETGRG